MHGIFLCMKSHRIAAAGLLILFTSPLTAQVEPRPRLVILVAVDQFRADYLQRFRADYSGGLDLLLTKGAVFEDARLEHFPSVTATGHSTFLTGATPSLSGIIGNEWYDREQHRNVTSVSDEAVKLLGGSPGSGSSPHRLLVSTVGDELKLSDKSRSRVIGISLKDRGAILPAGHMADGAFWFDARTGNFVSSTYYFPELPGWVHQFNALRAGDRFKGVEWMGRRFPAQPGPGLYEALPASPFGNDLVEEFAERAIRAERLGQRDVTDLLSVSFSSNDYVGHAFGPDSPQVRDISVRTDRLLGKFFAFVDKQVGLRNVVIVFTADHGVVSLPDLNATRRMPGGRVSDAGLRDAVQRALEKRFGEGEWISGTGEFDFYLNRDLIAGKKLSQSEVEQVAADALLAIPHVFRVYTRAGLMNGPPPDPVTGKVLNGFNVQRSGDVWVLLDPYWIAAAKGTTHGSPFVYDIHVPLMFMGPGIRAGRYFDPVAENDIAPTLAAILGVQFPSGSVGRILHEMFESTPAGMQAAQR
jgi:hypothetical protein